MGKMLCKSHLSASTTELLLLPTTSISASLNCPQVFPSEGAEGEEEVLDVPELLASANTLTNPNNRKSNPRSKTEL